MTQRDETRPQDDHDADANPKAHPDPSGNQIKDPDDWALR